MSALPDDLDRWPDDPWELLGVEYGVGQRDLRRAYMRLVRRYKPEQFPEHFGRIRAAYEALRPWAGSDDEEPAAAGEEIAPAPQPAPQPAPHEPVRMSLADELDSAWELACTGDESKAYRLLIDLHDRHAHHADVFMRLYWLLTARPDLDARRRPCDWLWQGLQAVGWTGPLHELYRRELLDDPREALGARAEGLLDDPELTERIADLIECRWQVAGRLGEWEVIGRDVEKLLSGGVREEQSRARLLMAAVHQLAWAGDEAALLVDRCREELERMDHLHGQLDHELYRLDFLEELCATWTEALRDEAMPPQVAKLVRQSWDRPLEEVRPGLFALLEEVVGQPRAALRWLEQLQRDSPVVLAQLGSLLGSLRDDLGVSGTDADCPLLADRVRRFLETVDPERYQAWRPALVEFCLAEAVAPETVAGILQEGDLVTSILQDALKMDLTEESQTITNDLCQAINDDWAMRYLWLMHGLFWE